MKKLTNILFATGVSLLSILPFAKSAYSQNVFEGCDYLRKFEVVNRRGEGYTVNFNFANNPNIPEYDNDNFKEPFPGENKNYLEGLIMNIHFRYKESDLTEHDVIDINKYCNHVLEPFLELQKHPSYKGKKIKAIILQGHTDCLGSQIDNLPLGEDRGESVAERLNVHISDIPIYICSFGEKYSKETRDSTKRKEDRIVRVIPTDNIFASAFELCFGEGEDIVFLDQSGTSKSFWRYLQDYPYPDSVQVYAFSQPVLPYGMNSSFITPEKFPEHFHTFDIKKEVTGGKTAYYPGIDRLFDVIPRKTSLISVVNNDENVVGCSPQEILEKCKEKEVVFNLIGFNLNGQWKIDLVKIAQETGGVVYLLKKYNKNRTLGKIWVNKKY